MKNYKIVYKGKEYALEEIKKEQKLFQQGLEVPEFLKLDTMFDMFCVDPGYKIAKSIFDDLYIQVTSARFALIMGHQKLHDSNYISWQSGELGQLWLRSQYLRNSIIWYNSSYDLLWQSLWFGFALYRKILFKKPRRFIHDIDSKNTFQEVLKECKFNNLKTALDSVEKGEGAENAKKLMSKITDFHESDLQKKVREWANILKHHGNLKISELYNPPKSILKCGAFSSTYTAPLVIGIDEISDNLKEYHISLCNLIKFIHSFFDFEAMIGKQETGKMDISLIIEEEFYKKIIIK